MGLVYIRKRAVPHDVLAEATGAPQLKVDEIADLARQANDKGRL